MMDTVLFTDHDIVVFAITATAAALLLSVLGLATTQRIRSDMKDQFWREGAEQQVAASKVYVRLEAATSRDANEWASLKDEFNAAMREGAESIEYMLDEQFRRRFGELMYRTARAKRRESLAA
jgi:serine phosphatase RsbU (regulator of sigma subunit)